MVNQKTLTWTDGAVLTSALIVLTLGLGQYGLYEPHEGHFAGVAREMVLRADWVTPTLNGAPYLNKPPLLYWLGAASIHLFGFTEFAARFPLTLAGWLGIVVAWKWARELWGSIAGQVVALMLSVTSGWFIFTHQLLIDSLLASLLLAMLYCLWRFSWEPQSLRYCLALYGLLGLCLLAKGPLALIFFISGGGAIVLSRRSVKFFGQLKPVTGGGIVLTVSLPWFIAVERANPGFLQYLLINEHLKRLADTRWPPDYEVFTISPWGYLLITALWGLPWIFLLPQVLRFSWQEWYKGHSLTASVRSRRHSEGILLLVIAIAIPVLLFLPISSRLVYYSVPAIAPYIILCSGWWCRCQDSHHNSGRRAVGTIFGLLGIGLCGSALWLPSIMLKRLPELANTSGISIVMVSLLLALGLGLLIGGVLLLKKQSNLALFSLFIGLAAAWVIMAHGFVAIQDFRSAKTLIETANTRLGQETLWTFEGSRELGAAGAMSYYLDRSGQHQLSEIPQQSVQRSPEVDRRSSLPPGWAPGKEDTAYRTVLVLADGGPNRIPPQFPGPKPNYLITRNQLQAYWETPRPVVFVTDFLRQPDQPQDPPTLNLPKSAGQPLLKIGPRRLYGNSAAREIWLQQK